MIIQKNTVIVLGAGASHFLGYPTGSELRKVICSNPNFELMSVLGWGEYDIKQFLSAFEGSCEASIDRFLQDKTDYRTLGKYLIANVLFEHEDQAALTSLSTDRNWYRDFWNDIAHDFESIDKHNLHFVTFNYDRSLEQFLYTALSNSCFGTHNEKDCADKICKLDIRHVYGVLAPLEWQIEDHGNSSFKTYNPTAKASDYKRVVENLFLIGEERNGLKFEDHIQPIRDVMAQAEYIYFLGFGFDEKNIELLGSLKKAIRIGGTCLGLGKRREQEARKLIAKQCGVEGMRCAGPDLIDTDITDFLKDCIRLE